MRGVGVLAGGAALSQALNMFASPVLTRLYTREQYGVLSQYMALLAICLVVVSLRYEVTVPLADDEDEAVHLVSLGLLLSTVTSVCVLLVLLATGGSLAARLGFPSLGAFIFLLPLGLLGGGFYQSLNYWAIRQRWFPLIAKTRLQQVSGALSIQATFGGLAKASVLQVGPLGLILGSIANQTLGYTGFARRGKLIVRMREARVSWPVLVAAARRHRRTALGSSVSGFINVLGIQLPFLLMARIYGDAASGCLWLSSHIVTAGAELIGNAVGQTYYGEASARYREDRRALRRLFAKALRTLLAINVLAAATLWIAAPTVMSIVFGSKWADAGIFARYQSLVLLGTLTCSPLSTTIFILRKVHLQVVWDIFRIGVVAGSFYGAHYLQWGPSQAVLLYSAGSLAAYFLWVGILFVLVSRADDADDGTLGPADGPPKVTVA